jgi:hypothetical protein
MESSEYDKAKMSMEKAAPVTSQGQGLQYPLAGRETDDSNIFVVHHAIESIGMGKYQWQLLTTCGFGFLIDQLYFHSPSSTRQNTSANGIHVDASCIDQHPRS